MTLPLRVTVLHGPNLNLLGSREVAIYGTTTLDELNLALKHYGATVGLDVVTFQSNHEGALIDRLHDERTQSRGIVLNAGGLTHTSVSLRDAVVAIALPVIEVHISNTLARESFRHVSLLGPVCAGRIEGLGLWGYHLALLALAQRLGTHSLQTSVT